MMQERVRFVHSRDGTAIAWSRSGSGPPLLRAGVFMTHIEFEATNRVWGHWLADFSARFDYIRYDERGCGLSTRDPKHLGERVWIEDLSAVIAASGASQVALFGMSQGAALAVAYAAAHPEQVSHLVLLGGYAAGGMAPGQPEERAEKTRALAEMNRLFWREPTPSFHRVWTTRLVPGGSAEHLDALDQMQRSSSSGEMAAEILLARDVMDVRERAKQVGVPTLVAHSKNDGVVKYENGVELATLIPNATLLPLESRNHLLLDEPAWRTFIDAAAEFVGAGEPAPPVEGRPRLSERELEVLELVAQGLSNDLIARRLAMSVRTVERHLSNIYTKLGLSGKSARAAAAVQLARLRRDSD